MVDIGKFAKKAKDLVDKRGDKIAAGIDKATDLVDKKSKGKYRDKLDKVDEMAKKLDRTTKNDAGAERPEEQPKDG
ncbi:MAG: hypothetical protein QOG87_1198 [Actinomycetota bacterium]|jgi:hypothetical protein